MALIFDRKVPAGVVDVAMSTLGDLAGVPDSRGGRSPLARAIVSNTPLPVYSLRLDVLRGTPAGPALTLGNPGNLYGLALRVYLLYHSLCCCILRHARREPVALFVKGCFSRVP